MIRFISVVLIIFAYGRSQVTENEENCPGSTVNNYILGPDGYTMQPTVYTGESPKQGKPGKRGAQGEPGLKGNKGTKGEPGQADDTAEELQMLKDEVAEMKAKLGIYLTPPSCDYINRTEKTSGTYVISPDLWTVQPFSVYCNFTGETETIIEHNSMNEIQVTSCEPNKCYKRQIRYNVAMEQIVALIQRSSECRQYIKYRCIGSVLFQGNIDYAAWLSRDGTHIKYWGGATSRRNYFCACGETGTCLESGTNCNCDKNSGPETSDEGFLTDKDILPVTGLQFGDATAPGEYGWHTLGPLICTGRSE
ncbi:contactin-associated protein-like 4 [Clavelina lepadiformis]|uniref:contactin-associated protein-like 4 n=1 Tax=Clavelina lepadiformis TaxID=159417 RepID=UPI004042F511